MIIYTDLERDGETIPVTVRVKIGNDGIGAYEYHGMTGHDAGSSYPESWTVTRDDTGEEIETTPEDDKRIDDLAWAELAGDE